MIRLTIERERRELSKGELARRAKMHKSDVGKIETGRQLPYEKQLKKLGRAMRMRIPESLRLGDEVTEVERAAHEMWKAERELERAKSGFEPSILREAMKLAHPDHAPDDEDDDDEPVVTIGFSTRGEPGA